MTMGERIKQLRSSNGFTQEMLAKIIRIEKSLRKESKVVQTKKQY